ncbi:MAG: transglycosylase domain-containing protein [Spirochaeta sp.]
MNTRARRWIVLSVTGAAVTGIITVLLLPWAVHNLAVAQIENIQQRTGIEISYSSLVISFDRRVTLNKVDVSAADSQLYVTAEEFSILIQPLMLLRGLLPIGDMQAENISLLSEDSAEEILQISALQLETEASRGLHNLPEFRSIDIRHLQIDLSDPSLWATLWGTVPTTGPETVPAESTQDTGTVPAEETGTVPFRHRLQDSAAHFPALLSIQSSEIVLPGGRLRGRDMLLRHRPDDKSIEFRSAGAMFASSQQSIGSWEIGHRIWYESGAVQGNTRFTDINLSALGRMLGEPWDKRLLDGMLDLQISSRLTELSDTAAGEPASVSRGTIQLAHPEVYLPQAAPDSIRLQDSSYVFTLEHHQESAAMVQGELQHGEISIDFRPALHGLKGFLALPDTISAELRLPATRLQLILDTIPEVLLGDLHRIVIDGTAAWKLRIEVPADSISGLRWESEVDYQEVYLHSIPDSVNVFRLREPFIHQIHDPAADYSRVVHIGPMNAPSADWLTENSRLPEDRIQRLIGKKPARTAPEVIRSLQPAPQRFSPVLIPQDSEYRFTPLAEISPWVVRAIVTSEDGEFFRHQGINWHSFKSALERNINEGGFAVGASTIPMQLAKNLFLDHSRTLSRKLQEIILVVFIEQIAAVPKDRQMEIYLNIVEFGPGIFGIHEAAEHYFAKSPGELGINESVWLASILPSPKRFHYYYETGEITEGWFVRMKHILEIMRLRERISEKKYQLAVISKPQFAYPNNSDNRK